MTNVLSGVRLELGPKELSNNTLLIADDIGEAEEALFCATDRKACCSNESIDHSKWFLPNGLRIELTNTSQTLYLSLEHQAIRLNHVSNSNSDELPAGVYHCEMMDENNITHYLYIGIYLESEGIITKLILLYSLYDIIVCTVCCRIRHYCIN